MFDSKSVPAAFVLHVPTVDILTDDDDPILRNSGWIAVTTSLFLHSLTRSTLCTARDAVSAYF